MRILTEYGEEALTLPLLEHVSGAGKGSIYQYFPNLDAIVAELYQRECHAAIEDSAFRLLFLDSRPEVTLESLLEKMINCSVALHDRLKSLHLSFHTRYSAYFDIGKIYGENYGLINFVDDHFVPLVLKTHPDVTADRAREAVTFLLQGMQSQFFNALEFYPEKIYEPDFQKYLINIGLWILDERLRSMEPQY
ncbi:hypothetical protein GCM10027217_22600 [Pseudomaricurvus hydrocarbonicus]